MIRCKTKLVINLRVTHVSQPEIDVFWHDVRMMLHYFLQITSRLGHVDVIEFNVTLMPVPGRRCSYNKLARIGLRLLLLMLTSLVPILKE